ncbi:hypothetical protein DFH06DRAFT_904033, partial [Mycena polygramma]
RLPVEVNSEIFIHCLPSGPEGFDSIKYDRMKPRSRNAPLLLLQICRTWRDIALGTPRLWSTVKL